MGRFDLIYEIFFFFFKVVEDKACEIPNPNFLVVFTFVLVFGAVHIFLSS